VLFYYSDIMLGVKIFLFFNLVAAAVSKKSYSNYKVLRVEIKNDEDARAISEVERSNKYDFWTRVRIGSHVDIMASPETLEDLHSIINSLELEFRIMIQDVQSLIDLENSADITITNNLAGHNMEWTSYHSLEDIYGWFDYLEATYDFCEKETIGQTYEHQDMIVMKVCKGGCGNKPAMWIDSGIHGREWIAPAVGTWMLNELVENRANHPELLDNLDWYFLPSANPDGYRKSRNDDRMWRKTTSFYEGNECQGTDPNRNWDTHWGDQNGASSDSCSLNYYGPEPWSEVEVRNLRDYLLAHNDTIKFYHALHSYRQQILMPWGYTTDPAPDFDAMYDLALLANEALFATHGEYYEPGCIACIIYTATGGALDWVYEIAGIPYTYTIELRDTGDYGVLLPPDQIIPNSEEVWAFHKVAAEIMIEEFGKK